MSAPVPINQLTGQADVSQATRVEQARAVAEVAAAVQVARDNPRDIDTARRALQASCSMYSLAEDAFYDFNQGGRVRGPTATLARELARCWGNFQSGTDELRRDTDNGYSEMKAWAWDLESNARRSVTFVVPHERDSSNGNGATLRSVRDIRNNNNNWAARGEREMILSTLPAWFVAEGEALCEATLKRGDGKSVEERRDGAVTAYERIGVSLDRIERKLGAVKDAWSVFDLAQLTQVHRAISRGAVSIDDEFPAPAVTIGAITSTARRTPAKQSASKPADPGPSEPPQYAPDDDGRPFGESDQ